MTDYIKAYQAKGFPFEKEEAERLEKELQTEVYLEASGVIRWKSNDSIPPSDVREFYDWLYPNVIDLDQCEKDNELDLVAFLDQYKREQPAEPSEEERFEMRAAFGPGKEIIDVFTGRKVIT